MEAWVSMALQDDRLLALAALIALDLLLGVAAALRCGTFQWREVGRFYKTQVIPVFLGYFALRLTLPRLSSEILGSAGGWLSESLSWLFWSAGIGSLLSSISKSVGSLGPLPPVPKTDRG
jgi:hypothetical protein